MNATGIMILAVVAFVSCWEIVALLCFPQEATISATLRSWGPWAALGFMLGATVLFWHCWVQPEGWWLGR
jgi:hypothetical protein